MNELFGGGGNVITMYPTPQSLKNKVDEYFESCFRKRTKFTERVRRDGGDLELVEIRTPTFSGLARYLGFQSRTQMLEYTNKRDEAYNAVLADAKLRLEDYLEAKLIYSRAPAGIMFALKNNAGWEEKSTRQLTSSDGQPLVFGWAEKAADVIDVSATPVEDKGVLPPGGAKFDGSISSHGNNDQS